MHGGPRKKARDQRRTSWAKDKSRNGCAHCLRPQPPPRVRIRRLNVRTPVTCTDVSGSRFACMRIQSPTPSNAPHAARVRRVRKNRRSPVRAARAVISPSSRFPLPSRPRRRPWRLDRPHDPLAGIQPWSEPSASRRRTRPRPGVWTRHTARPAARAASRLAAMQASQKRPRLSAFRRALVERHACVRVQTEMTTVHRFPVEAAEMSRAQASAVFA
jgi:hypothetical protein